MKSIILITALVCSLLPVRAQDAAKAAATFRIICSTDIAGPLKYDLHESPVEVVFSSGSISAPYQKPPAGDVILYNESPPAKNAPPGAKPVKVAIAIIAIPAQSKRSIVVLRPAAEGAKAPYTAAVAEDPADQPLATIRFINLSSYPAAFGLDKQTYQLPKGATITQGYPKPGAASMVKLAIRVDKSDEWLFTTERILHPSSRGLCILCDQVPTPAEPAHVAVTMRYEWVRPTVPAHP